MNKNFKKSALFLSYFVMLIVGFTFISDIASINTIDAQVANQAKNAACEGAKLGGSGNCTDEFGANRVNDIIAFAINVLSVIVGIAAVIVIIISGFRLITSGGDSNAVGTARNGIIYAIVGLVLVVFAQLIVEFVIGRSQTALDPPDNPAAVTLSSSPDTVTTGQTSAISWNAENASSCTATGDWSGDKPTIGSETVGPFTSARVYSYQLKCNGPEGTSDARLVNVRVNNP